METKNFKFRIDDMDDEKGVFKGHASIFGEVDSYNEVVEKGAFRKTLKENEGKFPLCWFHNVTEPLGMVFAKEAKQGLEIKGELNLDVQSAREKRSLMKQGAIKGLSIGFKTIKDAWDNQVRHLKEIKLYEISPITLNFQACPGAEIGDVKNLGLESKPMSLEEILERITSIESIDNLSVEEINLIKRSITHLEKFCPASEPDQTTRKLASIFSPVIEVLEKKDSDKPQPHLYGSMIEILRNLK